MLVLLAGIAMYVFVTASKTEKGAELENGSFSVGNEITSVTASYFSNKNVEAIVTYYSDKSASLDLLGTSSEKIMFDLAVSASGARYENKDLGLVLWEKAPELNIYKNDKIIFSGRKAEVVRSEADLKLLTSNEWFWTKTLNGTGPDAEKGGIIEPKKAGSFSLRFTEDGKVSGKTDCNSFGGTYTFSDSKITFSNLASTLMYCENSQEFEFVKMLTNSTSSQMFGEKDLLILENNVTIYFRKNKI